MSGPSREREAEAPHRGRPPIRLVIPPHGPANPYLSHLERDLAALGICSARFRQSVVAMGIAILRTRPHVLHLHWLHPFYENRSRRRSWLRLAASLTALRLLHLLGVRIVWTAHNIAHHEAKGANVDRACTRFVARHADAIIAHSDSAKRRLLAELPIPDADRVFVIPHGHYIDSYPNTMDRATARSRLQLPTSGPVLLFFGQIRPYKGALELIEAFARLDCSDARLVIAGRPLTDGDAQLVREASSNDLRVTLAFGHIPDDEIQTYMKACDAVVLPYRDILTSGAAVLAMSFGRACVVPKMACFTELLGEGGAVFYDPASEGGLLAGLQEAVSDVGRLDSMGAANVERARTWDWGSIARRTVAAYQTALGRRSRGSGAN